MSSTRRKLAALSPILGRLCSRSIQRHAVNFFSEKARLYGEIFMPRDKKTLPGVILCHGLGSDLRAVRSCAIVLARRGIAALAFDFQGHGNSVGVCEGDLVGDVKAAFRELTKHPEIDLQNIALVGHSLGARTILLAARELNGLKALVSLSCPPDDISPLASSSTSDLHRNLSHSGSHILEYPRDGRLPWLSLFQGMVSRLWMGIRGYRLRIDWHKCFELWGKAQTLAAVREMNPLPILFVHCRGDNKTSYQASIDLHEVAKEPKDLVISRGGLHSTPLLPGKVRSVWLDWLESRLKSCESAEDAI